MAVVERNKTKEKILNPIFSATNSMPVKLVACAIASAC